MNDNILRTIIRFAIIVVFLILLVFLSITLFKLIPKGINQLATASLSITGSTPNATTTLVDRTPQPVATTTNGLNGSIVIAEPTQTSGIVQTVGNTTYKPSSSHTYVPPTTYYPVAPRTTGQKNIKVTLIGLGIINKNTGQFISTNTFSTYDMIVVKYRISNDNDTETGLWNMRVEMPSINQGDRVRYANNINIPAYSSYNVEARFDGIDTSSNPVVRIYADIDNVIAETSEADNTLSVLLNSSNNNLNYNYNNNYNCAWYNTNCNTNYTSNTNLTVTSIETGKIVSGNFNPQTSFAYGERVTVRVNVRNTGGTFTNSWSTRLNYYDSYGVNRSLTTDNERPINPGDTFAITYTIDNLTRGNTNLNVTVDSNNSLYETNEGDNTISSAVYIY